MIQLWEAIVVRADWNPCEMHADLRRGHAGDLSRFSRTFWGRREATRCA